MDNSSSRSNCRVVILFTSSCMHISCATRAHTLSMRMSMRVWRIFDWKNLTKFIRTDKTNAQLDCRWTTKTRKMLCSPFELKKYSTFGHLIIVKEEFLYSLRPQMTWCRSSKKKKILCLVLGQHYKYIDNVIQAQIEWHSDCRFVSK